MITELHCGRFRLSLANPLIMGILNVTPDSFSDGGRFYTPEQAREHAQTLIAQGADILDVGGESSRPGAASVSTQEEMDRVLPIVEALAQASVPVSVDTTKPEVMRAAIAAGAAIINDITSLSSPSALEVLAGSDAAVCLMHMQGAPRTMQQAPHYENVVQEVSDYLSARVLLARAAGIADERMIIDPGFGFGKLLEHNLRLLAQLDQLQKLNLPVLAGLSRKSMLGQITGRPVEDRLPASLAAALIAVAKGAKILRVHDVAATRDALAVWQAVQAEE